MSTQVTVWRFVPPTGTWFRIPKRGGGTVTIDVLWRDSSEADITVDGEQQTVTSEELEGLYQQANYVSLPRRIVRSGIGKDGLLTHR